MRDADRQIYWGEEPYYIGQQVKQAAVEARSDGSTAWIVNDDGDPVAAIVPVADAERAMHASRVMIQTRQHEETVPVIVRAGRRRRWLRGWSPSEGVF